MELMISRCYMLNRLKLYLSLQVHLFNFNGWRSQSQPDLRCTINRFLIPALRFIEPLTPPAKRSSERLFHPMITDATHNYRTTVFQIVSNVKHFRRYAYHRYLPPQFQVREMRFCRRPTVKVDDIHCWRIRCPSMIMDLIQSEGHLHGFLVCKSHHFSASWKVSPF